MTLGPYFLLYTKNQPKFLSSMAKESKEKLLCFYLTQVWVASVQGNRWQNHWQGWGKEEPYYGWERKLLTAMLGIHMEASQNLQLECLNVTQLRPSWAHTQRMPACCRRSLIHVYWCSTHKSKERIRSTCPSTDEWIMKWTPVDNGISLSHKDGIKFTQNQRDKQIMITHMWSPAVHVCMWG